MKHVTLLSLESSLIHPNKRFDKILKMSFRTLQNCTHETYMDCPFYEQLMYVGDARIESLVTYTSTLDGRMPAKAVNMINYSRLENGLNMSCYPYRGKHVIPPFAFMDRYGERLCLLERWNLKVLVCFASPLICEELFFIFWNERTVMG